MYQTQVNLFRTEHGEYAMNTRCTRYLMEDIASSGCDAVRFMLHNRDSRGHPHQLGNTQQINLGSLATDALEHADTNSRHTIPCEGGRLELAMQPPPSSADNNAIKRFLSAIDGVFWTTARSV